MPNVLDSLSGPSMYVPYFTISLWEVQHGCRTALNRSIRKAHARRHDCTRHGLHEMGPAYLRAGTEEEKLGWYRERELHQCVNQRPQHRCALLQGFGHVLCQPQGRADCGEAVLLVGNP